MADTVTVGLDLDATDYMTAFAAVVAESKSTINYIKTDLNDLVKNMGGAVDGMNIRMKKQLTDGTVLSYSANPAADAKKAAAAARKEQQRRRRQMMGRIKRVGRVGSQVASGTGKGLSITGNKLNQLVSTGVSGFMKMTASVDAFAFALGAVAYNYIANLISDSIKLGIEWEKMGASFKTMTGSKSSGDKMLSDLEGLSLRSPYKLETLANEGRGLMSYGIQAKDVTSVLSRLGDVAGGNSERFKMLSYAFGQVNTAGRLLGNDLRQLTDAGISIEDLAKTMGKTVPEFLAMKEAGQVSASVVAETINRLTNTGGRFYESNKAQLDTVGGAFGRLAGNVQKAGKDIVLSLMTDLGVASGLNKLANQIPSMLFGVDTYLKRFAVFYDELKLASQPAIDAVVSGWKLVKQELHSLGSTLFGEAPSWDKYSAFAKKAVEEITSGILIGIKVVKEFTKAMGGVGDSLSETGIDWNFMKQEADSLIRLMITGFTTAAAALLPYIKEAVTLVGGMVAHFASMLQGLHRFHQSTEVLGVGPLQRFDNDLMDEMQKYNEKAINAGGWDKLSLSEQRDEYNKMQKEIDAGSGGRNYKNNRKRLLENLKKTDPEGARAVESDLMLKELAQSNSGNRIGIAMDVLGKKIEEGLDPKKILEAWDKILADTGTMMKRGPDAGGNAGEALMGGMFGLGKPTFRPRDISTKFSDPEADKMISEAHKDSYEGVSSFDKYMKERRVLDRASRMEDNMTDFVRPRNLQMSELEVARTGANQFRNLESSVKDQLEVKLPPAAMRDSREATDIINRSQNKVADIQQRVLMVLEAARDEAKRQLKETEDIGKVLKQIRDKERAADEGGGEL